MARQTDSTFESSMGEMVYAELQDRAPKLLDHLVGFQVIDKDDEDTSGVGVAVFQLGNQTLSAPMFFSGGRLKGGELLYLKDQDLFVPLKENWINFLMNRKPTLLGKGEAQQTQPAQAGSPDFSAFNELPYSKTAEARKQILEGMRAAWPEPRMFVAPNDARYKRIRSIGQFLKDAGSGMQIRLAGTLARNMDLTDRLLDFYKLTDILPVGKQAEQTEEDDFLNLPAPPKLKKKADGSKHYVEPEDAADNPPKSTDQAIRGSAPAEVKVYYGTADATNELEVFGDQDVEQLLRGEIVIKDDRPDGQVSRVYKFEPTRELTNPDGSGVYDVLMSDNKFIKLLVLMYPFHADDQATSEQSCSCLLIDPETGLARAAMPRDILVRKQYDRKEFDDVFDAKAIKHKDMRIGNIYVMINSKGESTAPFKLRQVVTNDVGVTQYEVSFDRTGLTVTTRHPSSHYDIYGYPPAYDSAQGEDPSSSYGLANTIIITNRKGGGALRSGRALFVDSTFKALKLKPHNKFYNYNNSSVKEVKKIRNTLNTGTLIGLYTDLVKRGCKPITLWKEGPQYILREGIKGRHTQKRLDKKAVAHQLACELSIQGDLVLDLIKNAGDRFNPQSFLIVTPNLDKAAQGSSPVAPSFPGMPTSFNQNLGVVETMPFVQEIPAPGATYDNVPDNPYDVPTPDFARSVIDPAARTGEKEVFDTAMLTGLVKAVDAPALVDEYIGDLILGLDRIGRILFLLYWHPQAFAERYGREDLASMEDSLKSVFQSLGDVILVLKQSTIEPEVGFEEATAQLPIRAV